MAIQFSKLRDKLGLDDNLPFGRYHGCTVEEVLKDSPEYISWLMRNTSLKFYPSVHDMLKIMKAKHVPSFKPVYFYDGTAHGEQAHYELSNIDYWDEDVPF